MIVCVCNDLKDSVCRKTAANEQCRGVGCIYRLNGARVRCGRCVPMMREIFDTSARSSHELATISPVLRQPDAASVVMRPASRAALDHHEA
jgi:bacterioferritin-associated ferredoxin